MADIEIKTDEVKSLVTNIDNTYNDLTTKIAELNNKKESIQNFWSSKEASEFINQLDKVSNMFVSFEKEYTIFINSLNNFLKMYDNEEDNFVSTINSFSNTKE